MKRSQGNARYTSSCLPLFFLSPLCLFRTFRYGLAILVLVCVFLAPPAKAQDQQLTATKLAVKAALIVKFSKFVDWPEDSFPSTDGIIHIGVVGDPAMAKQLTQFLESTAFAGHRFQLDVFENISDVSPCHVLFVGSKSSAQLGDLAQRLEGHPTLTIGDSQQFTRDGGVIRFVLSEGRFRWEINQAAAIKMDLQIDPNLLSYAVHVIKE